MSGIMQMFIASKVAITTVSADYLVIAGGGGGGGGGGTNYKACVCGGGGDDAAMMIKGSGPGKKEVGGGPEGVATVYYGFSAVVLDFYFGTVFNFDTVFIRSLCSDGGKKGF